MSRAVSGGYQPSSVEHAPWEWGERSLFRRVPRSWVRPGRVFGFDLFVVRSGRFHLFASRDSCIPKECLAWACGIELEFYVRAEDWAQAACIAKAHAEDDTLRHARVVAAARDVLAGAARSVLALYGGNPPGVVSRALSRTGALLDRIKDVPGIVDALECMRREKVSCLEHSFRVAVIATALLEYTMGYNVSDETLTRTSLGFLLHDIGMARIPRAIVRKEGGLDPFERSLVQMHPLWGGQRIPAGGLIGGETMEIVLGHHERPEGKGYPFGRVWKDLSAPVRICAMVDMFEALTAPRPYRDPLPPFDALRIVRSVFAREGGQDMFLALVRLVAGAL